MTRAHVPGNDCAAAGTPQTHPRKKHRLRVLFVEHSAAEVTHSLEELKRAGYEVEAEVAATPEEFRARLASCDCDVILCDYRLPGWSGAEVFAALRGLPDAPPCILVSGAVGDDAAVECVTQGAADYVLKDHLDRLPLAVERALADAAQLRSAQKATAERKALLHALDERVKELTAIHRVARLLQELEVSTSDLLREVAALLPPAWQYPEITAARLRFDGIEAATPNFSGSPWSLVSQFLTADGKVGTLEVVYLEERPPAAEGPFLAEERSLLNSLAEMLRVHFDRRRAQESRNRLAAILEASPDFVGTADTAGRVQYVNRAGRRLIGLDETHDVTSMHLRDFHPPWAAELLRERAIPAAVRSGIWQGESALRTRDGREIPVAQLVLAHKSEHDGSLQYLSSICRDITERSESERQIRAQARRQAAIAEISQMALAGTGFPQLAELAVKLVGQALQVELCEIFELLPDGKALLLRAGAGWDPALIGTAQVGSERESHAGYTLLVNEPVFVEEMAREKRFTESPLLWERGVASGLSVVIPGAQRPFGVLAAHSTRPRTFARDDALFLQAMANVLAAAVERKRAEQALLFSEERFARAFRSSPDAMAISSIPEGRYLEVNESFERLTGYAREEVLGRSAAELGLWDNLPDREEFLAQLAQRGRLQNFEGRFRTKSRELRIALLSADTIELHGQRCALTIARDITDRKLAEEALRRANRAYRVLAASSQALAVAADQQQLLREVCRICVELGGYRFAWVGIAEHDEQQRVRPVARAGYEAGYLDEITVTWSDSLHGRGPVGTAIRTGKPAIARSVEQDAKFRPWRKEATERGYGSVIALPIFANHEPFAALALYAAEADAFHAEEVELLTELAGNVSYGLRALQSRAERLRAEQALRASEARYRELVENATYGIYTATPEGRILQANPALVRMLGYASLEELLAVDLFTGVYSDPADRRLLIEQFLSAGRVQGVQVEWKRKDGQPILVQLSGRALRDAEGRVQLLEVIAEDVTERRLLERQLRQAQKFEAIGQLAGGIAHDFNNVLGAILGWAELGMQEVPGGDRLHTVLSKIRDQGERAAQLTRQLLAFARRQILEPRNINLNDVITEAATLLERIIGKDIELKLRLDADLDVARADPTQVEQVIMNLCVNARDAMPRGGKLVIETRNAEMDAAYCRQHVHARPGHYAMISVSDTGIGMDAATMERIFEPFFTTKEIGKGTGLGLATVYGIVKQHGGFIHVYSELGQGTTFRVYLPVGEGVAESKQHREPAEIRGGCETILIAEDHDGLREMARETLARLGYRVLVAADGAAACELFEQHRQEIALALLDIVLPLISGPDAYLRMCAAKPHLPVIFATGYSADASMLHSLREQEHTLLQKPYTPEALARAVREVLDHARHRTV